MGYVFSADAGKENIAHLQAHHLFLPVLSIVYIHRAAHHGKHFFAVVNVPL